MRACERRRGSWEQCAAPATIATGCPEAHDLLLEHGDGECWIALEQVPGRPEPRQPSTEDGDIHIESPGQRGPRGQVIGHGVVPEAEAAVVNIRHLAPTPEGMKVRAEIELVEVDRRRLRFKVQIYDEVELVGECEHERFVIDIDKAGERLRKKIEAMKR